MPSNVVEAINADALVDVVASVLPAGASPLQFWGMIVDAGLDGGGYPLMPVGEILLFADQPDVGAYFGQTSQEAGLADVYFTGPVNATRTPSGLLATQYALNNVPGFLRGGSVAGLSLGQLQAIDSSMTVVVDGGSPITATINLATATSFSNAAELIGFQLGTALGSSLHGLPKGNFHASLASTTMTVVAYTPSTANGPARATFTANLISASSQMVVTSTTAGYVALGQLVTGTGITAGTTVQSYSGGGVPGGVGTYILSAAPSDEVAVAVTASDPTPKIALGDVVTGTGIPANTYVAGFLTGSGGAGTYMLSTAVTTESSEAILLFSRFCSYNTLHSAFQIGSATTGTGSSVAFATGPAATSLALTQATGAVSSPGASASSPTAFMAGITAVTRNWVSFMTTWEPTDADKSTNQASSFAWWTSAQANDYRYCMWETSIADTTGNPGSAASAEVSAADLTGTVMIWTNPAITTLPGEKAAFSMGWAASLDFTRLNGRQTEAFKAYVGALSDVTDGTVADVLAGSPQSGTFGNGMNFYGNYTTRSAGFPQWQRGLISGPFVWDDTYTDQIWLNDSLQNSIMVGLTNSPSVPYAQAGYALIESWCLGPIQAAVDYGAIVPGVVLSPAQIQAINQATGVDAADTVVQRGWYLQIRPASAATRGLRTSPPATLYWSDGGSVQAINLASITVQ